MQETKPEDFFQAVRSFGASDVAVAKTADGPACLPFAVTVAVRLSDAIIDEIGPDGPTYTYFNHYRSVNYLIDQILLKTGLWLAERGARYITVAASQSSPDSPFDGRYSHKKAAALAGLGSIGRNGLFLHREWGPRVRLGTVFTDWPGAETFVNAASAHGAAGQSIAPVCNGCDACVRACPSGAIGRQQSSGVPQTDCGRLSVCDRLADFDPARCSAWMKKMYQNIGRGAVCGICIAVCPARGDAHRP